MSGFVLPTYSSPAAGGWAVVDYKPALTLTAKAGPDGTATATAAQIDVGYMWAIQRAVLSTSSTNGGTKARLYDGAVTAGSLLSGTDSGNYDEADYAAGPGMLVDQGRQLSVVWTGLNAGDTCTARLQVAVLSIVSAG